MDPSNSSTPYSPPPLTASESSDTDEVNSSSARVYFGPILSPEKNFIVQNIARRAAHKSGAFGSPVRRSPRLSTHPLSHFQSNNAVSLTACDDGAQDGAEGVEELTYDLPGEDTPTENDLQDEPSSVLATKIMRAFDNPSPPPRGRIYPGSDCIPAKDAQFPLLDVSVPPSPFRSINLFERLNQLAAPVDDSSLVFTGRPSISVPGDTGRAVLDAGHTSQHDLISFESRPASILQNATSALPIANPSVRLDVHDFLSATPERAFHPEVRVDGAGDLPSPASGSTTTMHTSASEVSCISGEPLEPLPLQRESEDEVDAALLPGTTSRSPEPTPPLLSADMSLFSVGDGSDRSLSTKARRKGKRTPEEGDSSSHHKLRSLSPQSAGVLTQLLPSLNSATQNQEAPLPTEKVQESEHSTPCVPKPPIQHPNLINSTIQRPLAAPTPIWSKHALRNASPLRFTHTLDESSRTPARRVPIHDAFTNITPSLKNSAQFALLEDQTGRFPKVRGDIFWRPDDTPRSPARRVPTAERIPSPSRSTASTCAHTFLHARSASVEPRPVIATPARSRSVEPSSTISRVRDNVEGKGPMFPRVLTTPRASTKLPYPLIATEKSEASSTYAIPEENESEETGGADTNLTTGVLASGPHKSQLKQPSVGSRIPRIGAKPYARPRGIANVSKVPSVPKTLPSNKPVTHVLSRTGTSHSSSDESTNQNTNELASPTRSALQTLKRKRGPGPIVNQSASHPNKIRQVVPGMLGGKYAVKPSSDPPSESNVPPVTNSLKPTAPIPFRKVVDGMLSVCHTPAKPSAKGGETPQPAKPSAKDEGTSHPAAPPVLPLDQTIHSFTNQSLPDEQPPLSPQTTSSKSPEAKVLNPPPDDASTLLTIDLEPSQKEGKSASKRLSRTRKLTSDVADVSSNTFRAAPSGRRLHTRPGNDIFMGMSATALKALTSSNTVKNQQTVALFAMEVIRKEGLRPESPTVKIRTILQRQREERHQQRKERAERRARRSDEGWGGSDTEGVTERFDQLLDVDDHDRTGDGMAIMHSRGPGDDEDYETPEKQRAVKRPRFGEDAHEEMKSTKQVKWHRGLSTAVCLDDIHPKPRAPSNHVIAKGCLAPSVKNLRLDTLGNITDIDNRPPLHLVQEPVVIKKYLYDNDVEPDHIPVPVRATRSKSKKLKG